MPREVKCRICGKKMPLNEAYCEKSGNVNKYYCSEKEYIDWLYTVEMRNKTNKIIEEILGFIPTYSVLNRDINKYREIENGYVLYNYLLDNERYITDVMRRKNFSSSYNATRYLSAIISGNIGTYKLPVKQIEKSMVDYMEDNDVSDEMDFVNKKRRESRKSTRRALTELED